VHVFHVHVLLSLNDGSCLDTVSGPSSRLGSITRLPRFGKGGVHSLLTIGDDCDDGIKDLWRWNNGARVADTYDELSGSEPTNHYELTNHTERLVEV
jgi:hypothetical protein